MQFLKVEEKDFGEVYRQMEDSFPLCERREFQEAKAVLKARDYNLFHIEDDGKRVGFISVWALDGFFFIEHFAVYPDFRNKGLGATALELAKKQFKSLVLEVEPPISDFAIRRLAFYERNGFYQNHFDYFQPAYRKGEKDVKLVILSFPEKLSDGEKTVKEIYKKVYGR